MMPFIDLQAQRRRIGAEIDAAILRVTASGQFIMGPDVEAFESELAAFGQSPLALSCSNGTDALTLVLMALGVGPGDAIFCPSFTFAATAESIVLRGATPVFVDIDPGTYTMDPAHLEATISMIELQGRLKPRAIIAVDLFGQPADYRRLEPMARARGLALIADSAQGFGCSLDGRHPITWADATTISFFPAKPLGCYGDGGAVLVRDGELLDLLRSLRVHGQASSADVQAIAFAHEPKYLNTRVGINGRMDTVQAAVLREKLKIFDDEIDRRNLIAATYTRGLAQHVSRTPKVIDAGRSTWAQYTIEHPERDRLVSHLRTADVPTAVYYPIPVHRQPAYAAHPSGPDGLPVTEAAAGRVLSLPMSAYLDSTAQAQVIDAVAAFS